MVFRKKMIQPNIFTESLIFSDDWDAKGLVIDKEKNKCKKCIMAWKWSKRKNSWFFRIDEGSPKNSKYPYHGKAY
jgi:hypothetical protein